ncbi:putative DNA binding domain-containing protein [Bradyrhizobium sp. SRL28]|uniref:AlbA family DNA-binding domain-containing protein n=1 Tax=Bradyrhizobium sp. SRL28 TaxID=2836178 RepID=UPI001BDDD4D7|nr:RNA-binding domain-containing protein [Bradyrhizobium sp. SRL28]MBT1516529.1 putative DNA binding domain-containing protein [Bradyrhizobium sp. SRL28]
MALRHLAVNQIDEGQLQRLIDGKASETRDCEYKRAPYGNADKDHGEFLADIPSFANADGGDIIIGIDAQSGVPTRLTPLQIDADAEIVRLENIARSGLQPRIHGFEVRAVPVTGGTVILARIPRSYNQPHRIVRQGSGNNRFFARSSAGKYEPNVDELRILFNRAPQLADRIRDFRFDRVAKIAANNAVIPLLDTHALTLHVVPFSASDSRIALPLAPDKRMYSAFPPIGGSTQDFRINVDGLLTLSNAAVSAKQTRAYVQAYHNGVVEAVASSFLMGDGTDRQPYRLASLRTEVSIVKSSHLYLRQLRELGCAPPFALLVSLIGMKGVPYSFAGPNSIFEDEAGTLDRDQFHFTEVILEDIPADPYEYAKLLRPLLDQIANAAGRASTPSFDATGRYRNKVD